MHQEAFSTEFMFIHQCYLRKMERSVNSDLFQYIFSKLFHEPQTETKPLILLLYLFQKSKMSI